MEILTFRNVGYTYHTVRGELTAAQGLSFSVERGDFVAIIGPSGCGKTTLLSLAAGMLVPSEGEVRCGGTCGYMLPRDELFPWRTREKNLFLPLEVGHKKPEARARVCALAEKYGLKDFLKSYPAQLSGGMRQRAALSRTLATDPDILLLDEPFSALDYQTRLTVCNDVAAIIRSEQKTALLITHDISEAISVADRVLVLSARPARVLHTHTLDFDGVPPLKRRELPAFSKWFELLWRELNA